MLNIDKKQKVMKVIPFALTVVVAALLATACQKNEEVVTPATEANDGQFKPEKKLSKIYQTVEVTLYGVTHTIYENLLIAIPKPECFMNTTP